MRKRRWIAVFLCLVLGISSLCIPSESVQAETSYDEATILDEMADSWLETCEKNVEYCLLGLAKFELGALNQGTIDAIEKQLTEDILTGYKETTSVSCGLSVKELCRALGDESLRLDVDTYWRTLGSEDSEMKIENMAAEGRIKSKVKSGEVADGVSVMDVVKENYSLIIGLIECNSAIGYFKDALNSSDLSVKRENMLRGALVGTVGCQMSISDTDALLKNEGLSTEDLLVKIAETGIDLVGEIVPQVSIAKDVITITAEVGINVLFMRSKLDALSGFIHSPEFAEEDMSAFFDALSNQYGEYTYEISGLEVIMGEYKGYLLCENDYKDVEIPEKLYGFPVTGFSGCFAKELDITEITIPSGVRTRELAHVVENCDGLEKVYYNAVACEGWYLGSFFYGCDSDFEVIIGENVTVIPERFIMNCGISDIEFPEGITTMNQGTLWDCANLKTIIIPSTVTNFGIDAISNCENLETVYYNAIDAEAGYYNGVISNCGNDAEEMSIIFGEKVNATPSSFLYNCGVKSVVFPEGMTLIRDYAISECQRLETITIPSTITKFSDNYVCDCVFAKCNNLKTVNYNAKNATGYLVTLFYSIQSDFSINFGEGIKEIPEEFMYNCGITSISFPEGITTINENCLVNCDSLEYVTVPTTVTTIRYNFVANCENIDTIYYNATGVKASTSAIISDSGNIDNPHMKVMLGDNVTTVPENFIKNCGITNFIYPEGVANINANSLVNCNSLKTVVIPSTVTAISNYVVSGCQNLSDIYYYAINAQMISTYGYVFDNSGNTSGLEIHVAGGVESIPSKWMYNCGVSSVVFPEGITSMGSNALVGCKQLESVTLPSTLSENSSQIINSCDNLKTLNYNTSHIVGDNSVYNKSIVYDCKADFTINFGTSVKRLPSYFIYSCGISSIDLPDNITYVGYNAFSGCSSLSSIRFENPDCTISDSSGTIPKQTTIYGYFDSTAYDYAVKYGRDFELIEEKYTGTLGVNDNFYYKYDETTQTLTIIGADEFESCTDEKGTIYVDMPNYTVKKVLFEECAFTGSLCGLLGKYKNSVEEVVFENCDTEDVTNISEMFSGCCNLTTVDFGDFDTSNVVDMSGLFIECRNLKEIDISNFKLYSGCNTDSVFTKDSCVEVIHTPYYMDTDIEIKLPYDFEDEDGTILRSITRVNRRKTITIHRETKIIGDMNDDGVVDKADQVVLMRYLAKKEGYNADTVNLLVADINEDGNINIKDLVCLKKYLADIKAVNVNC